MDNKSEVATLAGGCFWCLEAIFDELSGVLSVESGYTGGQVANPTYAHVCDGDTGHAEAVRITFDPEQVSYHDLLTVFFAIHDPTSLNRQGADIGTQYRSAIFYHNEKQRELALKSKENFDKSGVFNQKAVTEIVPATKFYLAEEYHQDYFAKNGGRVCHILREE